MANSPRTSRRAAQLLSRVVAMQWFDADAIACELLVTTATLDKYLTGLEPIPLDQQLCLALFVIERVPALARQGHQLRGQVLAAVAFEAGATQRHAGPPSRPYFR